MKKQSIRQVSKKQINSQHCFVCGLNNDKGIKARFYEVDGDELVALFTPHNMHQGYPGRLHGGIAASILDELIFRAFQMKDENAWAVTVDLSVKYRKPLPVEVELKAIGRVTKESRLLCEGTGEIYTPDGELAVTAWGKYMRIPPEQLSDAPLEDILLCEDSTNDPEIIEI